MLWNSSPRCKILRVDLLNYKIIIFAYNLTKYLLLLRHYYLYLSNLKCSNFYYELKIIHNNKYNFRIAKMKRFFFFLSFSIFYLAKKVESQNNHFDSNSAYHSCDAYIYVLKVNVFSAYITSYSYIYLIIVVLCACDSIANFHKIRIIAWRFSSQKLLGFTYYYYSLWYLESDVLVVYANNN